MHNDLLNRPIIFSLSQFHLTFLCLFAISNHLDATMQDAGEWPHTFLSQNNKNHHESSCEIHNYSGISFIYNSLNTPSVCIISQHQAFRKCLFMEQNILHLMWCHINFKIFVHISSNLVNAVNDTNMKCMQNFVWIYIVMLPSQHNIHTVEW